MRIISFIISLYMMFNTVIGNNIAIAQTGYAGDCYKLSNPLKDGCDPWFYQYDGKYYYCYGTGNGVGVRCADTIEGLIEAEHKQVYVAPSGTMYSNHYWAPELHCIDGKWYVYVCASDDTNENHRMYVLCCDTPLGEYEMLGKLTDSTDCWAIDGTVCEINGELYTIWSGWQGETDGEQELYIAHMSDPAHIDSERTLISKPQFKWEKNGMALNEAPEVLQYNGETYIVYSASGSWTDDYCLGMLKLCGKNPLKKSSWAKCPVPVFSKANGVFGVGHCSFVKSADSKYNYIVYHGMTESGAGWNGRKVMIQRFEFVNDYPVFGKPVAAGNTIEIAS